MLVWLADYLTQYVSAFNGFSYLTFRPILGILTALLLSLYFGPKLIAALQRLQIGQTVRNDGPESHFSKKGTPTMGGLLILGSIAVSTLLWADLTNKYVWVVLFVLVAYGWIGFIDDYRKVIRKDPKGLIARWKYFWQSVFALVTAFFLYATADRAAETSLVVPFIKDVLPQLGLFYLVTTYFVMVGFSNAVNLTDGLDGLAIVPTIMVAAAFAFIAYVSGNAVFANYLNIPHLPLTSELVVVCASIIGAGLGFLWFNTYPAQVFMGDVGSLALGAILGVIAVLVRQEIVLIIMGGIFVIETMSVILQVGSYKLRGQRIFRMAPIHHHFQLGGISESKVVIRFWIVSILLSLLGLASLKLQ